MYQPKNERNYPSSIDYFLAFARVVNGKPYTRFNLPSGEKADFLSLSKEGLKRIGEGQRKNLDKVPVYAIVKETSSNIDIDYWMFYPFNRGNHRQPRLPLVELFIWMYSNLNYLSV